jgi:hypothetical protein
MEPITTILAALVAGASAAIEPLAGQVLTDAYQGLKTFIQTHYAKVGLSQLEESPDSQARRAVVAEDLVKAGGQKDGELLRLSKVLLDKLASQTPSHGKSTAVDIWRVKAASITLEDIVGSEDAVRIREVESAGAIVVKNIRSGQDKKKE